MANKEHVELLQQGVGIWNQWRKAHPDIQPDLSGVDLHRIDLRHARLSFASLNNTDLSNANLHQAYLVSTDLSYAHLESALLTNARLDSASCIGINLSYAKLTNAKLRGVRFDRAILKRANFSFTDLQRANLVGAELQQTNFYSATIGYTSLVNITLNTVQALETVVHTGPSHIGLQTLVRSQEHLPVSFLRGAGVPERFIEYRHSHTTMPITYSTCFLVYASQDQAFIERIRADLQAKEVLCWVLPYDQRDDEMNQRVIAAIEAYDIVLPVFSQYTTTSSNSTVTNIIKAVLAKEQIESSTILYPIHLDQTLAETEKGWANLIRRTHRSRDFTQWKDESGYQIAFHQLLKDLRI